MTDTTPQRYAFVKDDLSMYERIAPEAFPDFDQVDSRDIDINQLDARCWKAPDAS